MAFPATEQAVLTVNGTDYKDWESVAVIHEIMPRPAYRFRFTCSEDSPISANFGVMRIRPGDKCTITLAGILAFSGLVSTRQVFYDARRHYVEIQGVNFSDITSVTSTVTKTQEYKNVTVEQLIRAELQPYSNLFQVVFEGGLLPQTKFPRINKSHGMSTYDLIQMHLRSLGSFGITSNPKGDFVVIAGPTGGSDTVTEGVNIIEGREVIYNDAAGNSGAIPVLGQFPGDDGSWGHDVAALPFFSQTFQGFGKQGYGPLVTPLEIPAWAKAHTQGRSNAERDWQHQDEITVTVTVYGWLRPSGGLWQRGQIVQVKSPMLIMTGNEGLKAYSITFSQDNNTGTRTQLVLQNEQAATHGIPSLQE